MHMYAAECQAGGRGGGVEEGRYSTMLRPEGGVGVAYRVGSGM